MVAKVFRRTCMATIGIGLRGRLRVIMKNALMDLIMLLLIELIEFEKQRKEKDDLLTAES